MEQLTSVNFWMVGGTLFAAHAGPSVKLPILWLHVPDIAL